MDPTLNPYTPNAGAEPPVLAGRDDLERRFDILLARILKGRSEQSMIVTGLRGVGKTVLLEQFRKKAVNGDWVVIDREIVKHDDDGFRLALASWMRTALLRLSPRQRWTARLGEALGVLRSFSVSVDPDGRLVAGIDVAPEPGLADQGMLPQDVTDLFVAAGQAAQEHGKGIIFLLDEIQFLAPAQFEAVIMGLHKTTQFGLPVTLVGAGLPQVPELAGDAKSYAERLFVFPRIGHLDDAQARLALDGPARSEGVSWTGTALDVAIKETQGYPYFLQELGYATWLTASGSQVTDDDVRQALAQYQDKLDTSFFAVRVDRATDLQRAYLRAMAEFGGDVQRTSDVAERLGRTSSQVAPTRAELINMGLLYTPQHGYAAFTVPQFDRFMKRVMPTFTVPPHRSRSAAKP